jgi:hypothetical protein
MADPQSCRRATRGVVASIVPLVLAAVVHPSEAWEPAILCVNHPVRLCGLSVSPIRQHFRGISLDDSEFASSNLLRPSIARAWVPVNQPRTAAWVHLDHHPTDMMPGSESPMLCSNSQARCCSVIVGRINPILALTAH